MAALPILTDITKYEYTRIRGFRLEQLANGAIPYVHVEEDRASGGQPESIESIFNREAYAGQLPYQIQRDKHTRVTSYKLCLDSLGRARRIKLRWRYRRSSKQDDGGTILVLPSVSVRSVLDQIAEAAGASVSKLYYLGSPLSESSLLWDGGVIDDAEMEVSI